VNGDPPDLSLVALKAMAQAIGYSYERSETETEIIEQMIRPDGSVAVTAARPKVHHTQTGGDPLMRPGQAASRLGVTTETLRRWMAKGALEYVEVGPFRRKRIRLSEVERFRIG
jgi:excisionase family DNA binding protein